MWRRSSRLRPGGQHATVQAPLLLYLQAAQIMPRVLCNCMWSPPATGPILHTLTVAPPAFVQRQVLGHDGGAVVVVGLRQGQQRFSRGRHKATQVQRRCSQAGRLHSSNDSGGPANSMAVRAGAALPGWNTGRYSVHQLPAANAAISCGHSEELQLLF